MPSDIHHVTTPPVHTTHGAVVPCCDIRVHYSTQHPRVPAMHLPDQCAFALKSFAHVAIPCRYLASLMNFRLVLGTSHKANNISLTSICLPHFHVLCLFDTPTLPIAFNFATYDMSSGRMSRSSNSSFLVYRCWRPGTSSRPSGCRLLTIPGLWPDARSFSSLLAAPPVPRH